MKTILDLSRAQAEKPINSGGIVITRMLMKYAKQDPRICYVGVDTMDETFRKAYPNRAFDVGIAEQNEMALATGLCKSGLIPIIQGWSPFTPLRNFDQLRTGLVRHHCNAKIMSVALGLINCSHGPTHHDYESFALLRTIPNLTILCPIDEPQFDLAFDLAMQINGPVIILAAAENYAPGSEIMESLPILDNSQLGIGKGQWLSKGKDANIITFGPALHYSWTAAQKLERQGFSIGVLHMFSLKPIDQASIIEAARGTKALLSVEEQNIQGGLGSAISEILSENALAIPFKRMGIPDIFVEQVGDYSDTRRGVNLTSEKVMETLKNLWK